MTKHTTFALRALSFLIFMWASYSIGYQIGHDKVSKTHGEGKCQSFTYPTPKPFENWLAYDESRQQTIQLSLPTKTHFVGDTLRADDNTMLFLMRVVNDDVHWSQPFEFLPFYTHLRNNALEPTRWRFEEEFITYQLCNQAESAPINGVWIGEMFRVSPNEHYLYDSHQVIRRIVAGKVVDTWEK